jgi:hypothetical protein
VDADHRIVVDVHGPHQRVDLVRDLVHVSLRGQARADVEDLADPRLAHQVTDNPAQEGPVGLGTDGRVGRYPQGRLDDLAVGGEIILSAQESEIILSAQESIVDTGDVRRFRVGALGWVLAAAGTILSGH